MEIRREGMGRVAWSVAGIVMVLAAIAVVPISRISGKGVPKKARAVPTHARVANVETGLHHSKPDAELPSELSKSAKPEIVLKPILQDVPGDAVSREFVLFKGSAFGDEPNDAVSREFVLYNGNGPQGVPTDAIAREFVLYNGNGPQGTPIDAIAREFVLYNGNGPQGVPTDAVAREFVLSKSNDASSIPTDAIAREFVVAVTDIVPPTAIITVGPREGGHVAPGTVHFEWTGTDNITPPGQLQYQYRIDGGVWSGFSTTTATTTPSLAIGDHTFEVQAKDLTGNIQTPPTARHFTAETTPPDVTELGVKDIAWDSVTVYWRTNEIARGTVHYGLQATNDFRFDEPSIPDLLTYHEVRLKSLSSKTLYHFKVDLVDEAGNTATSNTLQFTTALLYDLSVRPEDISFSIPFPANGNSITMSALVRNSGDADLVGNVDFYDYRADTGVTLLGTQTVTLHPYTAPTLVTSPSFVVHERVHKPFVAIRVNRDDIPSNNRADRDLFVNAQPYRLSFTAPTVNTWRSDVQQFTVNVQNTGSQAQTLTDARVEGISFATRVSPLPTEPIPAGEFRQVTFQVNTPSGQATGTLSGQIVVVGHDEYRQPLSVVVFATPVAQLQVRLVNQRTGLGITNGIVVVGNDPRVYTTGPNGYVADTGGNPMTVPVPVGNAIVYGYAQNYMPKSGSVEIVSGNNNLTISLEEGSAFQITQVTTTPLTTQQIIDRGVNLTDPQNFWVYDFVLYMEIGAVTVHNVIAPSGGGGGGGGYSSTFGGSGSVGGVPFEITGSFTENTTTWIIIPGDVRILKQFWDATVTVQNRTTGFEIHDVDATLSVPVGIGLPDLFGSPQPTTKHLGTLLPGENKQAIWTIRGDFPGEYRLTGRSNGNLILGGVPIPLESTLTSEPITVASPSIEITFTTPLAVSAGAPFDVGVHVRNTSTIDLQFVQVNIKDDKLVNCHLASARTVDLGTLLRNETKTAVFTFISHVTGIVLNVYSIITPPPLEPPVTVVPGKMKILSVDDTDPRNPKIRFECADAQAVVARIAGRTYNLGALSEGTHDATLANLDTVAPGIYQLEIDGLYQGTHLIDTATFDSRLIPATATTGNTTFTVNGASKNLGYNGVLVVRRWEWNITGELYTRMIVGANAQLDSSLVPPQGRQGIPQVQLFPPTSGSVGNGLTFVTTSSSSRNGNLSWTCRAQNGRIFANPGAVCSIRMYASYNGVPWMFGGSAFFAFPVTSP